ncbi:focadhesin [Osmia bicornis bicornis]|uniref:focadhesin n=1 Tax=Osmia bicornis bicornis TaxID=1437191 RepID=UPI001EAE850D|nr:focadhesin [Osmia bicornis bicornis]
MDEVDYKLDSGNPVLISHAISKLFDSIKKKKNDQQTDHVSKTAEFKLLLTKRDSGDTVLSISACQGLIALVENGLWDISEALSTFTSSLSSIRNYTVAATALSRLLILDLKYDKENKIMYPFTLHVPQHPFIMILTRDKRSWQTVLNQMMFIMNHPDPRVKESCIEMLRPVFLYILCNPSVDSVDCCMQQAWQLLIKSKHSIHLQTEILLWLCTAETYSCINANYRFLELSEKALLEKNKEYCTALLPMMASMIIQLLKQGSDPKPNFDAMSSIINYCDNRIGDLALVLMAEIIVSCPAIYLYNAMQMCVLITSKLCCSDIFLNVLLASILKWMAYPSVLCSDALDVARDLIQTMFAKAKPTENNGTIFSSRIFTIFTYSDSHIQFYTEIIRCLSVWKVNDVISWLKSMLNVPFDLKDKCKLLISGLLLQTHEPQVTEFCCNVLIDVAKDKKDFGSHVLSLILHKLTKSRSSLESKYLLLAVPELVITKGNIPIITHTLDTLLNGGKQLKYFTIELYLRTLRKEPRCHRFVSTAIIRMIKSDPTWCSDATCTRAMKYVCENYPEHGEKLVPLISQILNRSTNMNGGTASALALKCISALCKGSITDICSTWKVLAPKMEKEKRPIVLESLCEMFGDITSYPSSQHAEEYDALINNVVSKLWQYTLHNDIKVIEAAFKALASYRLEQIPLKALPAEFRKDLVLPAAYAKTPIDAARKPEDVLPYIPATCWIQMLQRVNKMALTSAGNLLVSLITEEVNGFRSGIYVWPKGDPNNFKYLPEKSVIRGVGEYLRRCDKSDSSNHRIIIECLRIFAYKYPKPLPNINWSFLNDIIDISLETKKYVLSIACRHATTSLSAKSFIENYLLIYKSVDEANLACKSNEYAILYTHLHDLCQAVQPNFLKPFLEVTLEYVIEKMNIESKESIESFQCIMSSYAQALKNQETYDANSTLLSTTLEKLLDKIDLTCNRFEYYFTAALELSITHLERMTSPKVWWEVTPCKLRNAIAIRAQLALKKVSDSPLTWLNEIIDDVASLTSVQTYFLEIMQKVQAQMRFDKSSINWVIDFTTQMQGLLMESQNHCDKVQFYCDVLFVSIVSLSGINDMLMKQDLLISSRDDRVQLFPEALMVLLNRQDWRHAIPQIMEWLNHMRTSPISSTCKFTFHRSLICLKHNAYYKEVWTKYLSIKTDINV